MEHSSRLKIKAAAIAAGLIAVPAAVQAAHITHLREALRTSVAYEGPPAVDGIYGEQYSGDPVNLVGTGDSLLAGLWAGNRTSMQWVALLLANEIQRPVELFNVAVTGAKVSDLDGQLQKADGRLKGRQPDVVLLSVGATDIQDRNKFGKVRGHMRDILDEWNRRGGQVVVATPPPMDAPTPLNGNVGGKYIGGKAAQWSEEEKEFVREFANHGHGVTLADFGELMGVFYGNPRLFASGDPTHPQPDDFHPGRLGQEIAAGLVIPSVLEAYRKSRDAAGNRLPAHPAQKISTDTAIPYLARCGTLSSLPPHTRRVPRVIGTSQVRRRLDPIPQVAGLKRTTLQRGYSEVLCAESRGSLLAGGSAAWPSSSIDRKKPGGD